LPELQEMIEEIRQQPRDDTREPPRWQANRDYLQAHLLLLTAHLYEYQTALGAIRKELPPFDPQKQRGWRLGSSTQLACDVEGKKMVREAERLLEKLAVDRPGTPWEMLANRLKAVPVGLEWRPLP
jgi:hypothetical protein